jgi:hypothetical protein
MYSSTHSLTSALDAGEWSASRLGRFTPRERAPGTHWIGDWVGPRAVLNAVVKRNIPSPHRKSNPRTPIIQPVAQRCTNWAITAVDVTGGEWKLLKEELNLSTFKCWWEIMFISDNMNNSPLKILFRSHFQKKYLLYLLNCLLKRPAKLIWKS